MSTRPVEYQSACIVKAEVAYKVSEPSKKGTHAGEGSLAVGRVVWVSEPLNQELSTGTVVAFADGIGEISIERQVLSQVPIE